MVYDMHGNIVAQLDVDEGMFFVPLYPGDYTLEVKFEGRQSGYKGKIHMLSDDISEEIYLKPFK
jgi:hypothetical protein